MTMGRAFVTAALVALVMLPFSAEAKNNGKNGKNKAAKANGSGPAFCRSGEGHPVHGRQWCRDKGWDVNDSSVFDLGRARGKDRDRDDRDRTRRERDRREQDRDRDDRDRDDDRGGARDRFPWFF